MSHYLPNTWLIMDPSSTQDHLIDASSKTMKVVPISDSHFHFDMIKSLGHSNMIIR